MKPKPPTPGPQQFLDLGIAPLLYWGHAGRDASRQYRARVAAALFAARGSVAFTDTLGRRIHVVRTPTEARWRALIVG